MRDPFGLSEPATLQDPYPVYAREAAGNRNPDELAAPDRLDLERITIRGLCSLRLRVS